MSTHDGLKKIPREGFLKIPEKKGTSLASEQRVVLIRKGNELFNQGEIEKAKRIFLTAGYGDGLSRIGDFYNEKNEPLEALRMYWIAPSPRKIEILMEKFSEVVKTWLAEEKGKSKNETGTNGHNES